MIRVALVEDHLMFRTTLKEFIESSNEFKVVFETADGLEIEQKYHPNDIDVVLLDLRLKGQHGLITCRNLCEKYPDLKVIILSQYDDPELILSMIENGARAYITKDECPYRMQKIIHNVIDNGFYFDQNLGEMRRMEMAKAYKKRLIGDEFRVEFTPAEIMITLLVFNQHSDAEIEEKIQMPSKSLEKAKKKLLEKTHSKKFTGVIGYMLKAHVIFPKDFDQESNFRW